MGEWKHLLKISEVVKNRIDKLFEKKPKDILSVFLTAGYPHEDDTVKIIRELGKKGIDMVEIGVPFSDPLADGPVIQASSTKAIENGITLPKILNQVKEARAEMPEMPFILMGYLNPIMQYGYSNFFHDAMEAGADGVIIPDLPFDVYLQDFKELSRKYDLPVIMLITPETSEERIRLIDKECDGFIYMVSSASTTGAKDRFTDEQLSYFRRINNMDLKHKRLIGFGISNPSTLREAWENSSGAIIGSFFIKNLEENATIKKAVECFTTALGLD